MAMMTMSDLQTELVEEILSRVPLKSVRAVRLTCKRWNTLLKSRSFTTSHISKLAAEAKEAGESPMIVMMDSNVYLKSVVFNGNPSTKSLGKLTCLNKDKQVKVSQVFHCEGFLLCILKDENNWIVVWNPYLGQTKWIRTRNPDELDSLDHYIFAIGYEDNKNNSSCRSYKILMFRLHCHGCIGHHVFWFATYDFDSNSWRFHDLPVPWNIAFCDRGVTLKGNTYWCTTNGLGEVMHVGRFDFTKLTFGGFQNLPFRVPIRQHVTLSCVRDEKLSVLVQPSLCFVMDIWITDKIEGEKKVSWSKFLSVNMEPRTELRISDRGFFIEEEKKVAMVINKDREGRLDTVKIFGEAGYYRELVLGEPSDKSCWPLGLLCSKFNANQVT